VAAIGKPLELHEMRRQGGCDIRLTFDRVHRVVLAAEHQGWALDPMQIRKQVEAVALAIRSGEPEQHVRPTDGAARHVRIARTAEVMRYRQSSPGVERSLAGVAFDFQKMASRQRTDFGTAKALEQFDAPA